MNNTPASTLIARFTFQAEEDGEISLSAGEYVTLEPSNDSNEAGAAQDGWVLVRNSQGSIGFVPRDYLMIAPLNIIKNISQAPPPVVLSPPVAEMSPDTQVISVREENDTEASQSSVDIPVAEPQSEISAMTPSASARAKMLGMKRIVPVIAKITSPLNSARSMQVSDMSESFSAPTYSIKETNNQDQHRPSFIPSMMSADTSDIDDLLKHNDEWFQSMLKNQAESFKTLDDSLDSSVKKLVDVVQGSQEIIQSLIKLDGQIEDERKRWRAQNDLERSLEPAPGLPPIPRKHRTHDLQVTYTYCI